MARAAKTAVVVDVAEKRDTLSQLLSDTLNKKSKGDRVSYFLKNDAASPTEISGWVSTGSSMLDLAISNRPHGGLPIGKIVELTGLEGTGKSLICFHILKNTQDAGGIGVLIDTEAAAYAQYMEAIGVNINDLVYIPAETIEECWDHIENVIGTIRAEDKDRPITIILDSVAGASTEAEKASDTSNDGWATQKARNMSKNLRRITHLIGKEKVLLVCTNQLRVDPSVTFGDKYVTSGGKALGFHSSVRVRLLNAGKIKTKIGKNETQIGVTAGAKIFKNRCGPPQRQAQFDIYFDRGIDDYSSWLEVLKLHELVTRGGSWFTFKRPDNGEEVKFQGNTFADSLNGDPELREQVYQVIAQTIISKYRNSADLSEDEIMKEKVDSTAIQAQLDQFGEDD